MDKITKRYLPAIFFTIVTVTTLVYHLTTRLPPSLTVPGLLAFDLLVVLLVLPMLRHCRLTLGDSHGLLFFFTAAMFMGCQESLWIFLGKLGVLGDTYTFTTGLLWFFYAPFNVCLGWFIVCYAGYFLSRWAFPKASSLKVAAMSGFLAVCVDLWLDPAAANLNRALNVPNLWDWVQTPEPTLFSIRFSNFWGWFVAVGVFVFIFDTSWRQAQAKASCRPRTYFARLGLGWVLVFLCIKPLEKLLEAIAPGYELLPLTYESGHLPTLLTWLSLALLPALILVCVIIYIRKAGKDKRIRKDKWFLIGYAAYYLINLGIAYTVQIAFPDSGLIFIILVSGCVPWVLMLYCLTTGASTGILTTETPGTQSFS
ncbi:MAG: carotenoid biosynthesis protein [Anaerolineae bacterium]|nr:carotenoid biosynthesis protein [Anaerolineae bacterium]